MFLLLGTLNSSSGPSKPSKMNLGVYLNKYKNPNYHFNGNISVKEKNKLVRQSYIWS